VVTELQDAQENIELAVLSAVEHGQCPDTTLATQIACAALVASAGLDPERSKLYADLVLISLSERVRREVLQVLNSLGFEYQSDFARKYVAQGIAEGRLEIILKLLTLRFGELTDATRSRLRKAPDAQLDSVAERVLTAQTLDEALEALS
jgi:hypothetical protein